MHLSTLISSFHTATALITTASILSATIPKRIAAVRKVVDIIALNVGHASHQPVGKFTTDLNLKYINGIFWSLESELVYVSSKGETVTVPKGFITDMASVPKLFWNIFPPMGDGSKYGEAAVVHDFLYATQKIPKPQSDNFFLDAMNTLCVPMWKRYLLYYAVAFFGQSSWNEDGKKIVKS